MRTAHKQMVETRRQYKFETLFECSRFARAPRTESYLRTLCTRVWSKHGRKNVGVPDVRVVPQLPFSYCRGFSEIKLTVSLGHNSIEGLLHELVHAMGYSTHGRGFARRYVALLSEYGRCEEGKLLLAMSMFGIKV